MSRRPVILLALLGLGFVLPALFAAALAPEDPFAMDLARSLAPPGPGGFLGRDELGADILSRLIYGARISLLVGLTSVAVSALIGIVMGLVAGYSGGWLDLLLMRAVDVFMAFPGLLLAIALVAVLGPGLSNVVLALSALGWTGFARLARGQVLALRDQEQVQAAQALGAGTARVLFLHILPNILGPVLVQTSFAVAAAILAEASLSFLGLGAPPGTPSWGAMLAEGKHVLLEAPHVSVTPGLAIAGVVLGFNLLGDSLGDWLDPKRGRR